MLAYYECEGESMNFWERNNYQSNDNNQNKQSNPSNSNVNQSSSQAINNQYAQTQNTNFNVMEHIARLNGMSEEDRIKELTKTATSMKQGGSLNIQELERVYQTASMFMNGDQLEKLRNLIDMLKQ